MKLFRDKKRDETTVRLNRQHERIAELERELARVSPQVAALEERLADAQAQPAKPRDLGNVMGSEDPAAAELLAAIRAEHARIRVRISAASKYEERLRRLEEQLEEVQLGTIHSPRRVPEQHRTVRPPHLTAPASSVRPLS